MVKLILFAVIGLVVGLGGGSAVSVMKAKKAFAAEVALKAQVVADSLAKAEEGGPRDTAHASTDSVAVGDSASHDSTAVAPTRNASGSHRAAPSVAAGGAPSGTPGNTRPASRGDSAPPAANPVNPRSYSRATQTVESNGAQRDPARPAAPSVPGKPIVTSAPPPGAAKLAKIFAAMPPKDAAKVLDQLDDADVQSVIATLSEKQAAAILQHFPAPRAAVISKAVLRSVPAKP